MADQPRAPKECDKTIYEKGIFVCMTDSIPADATEQWVQKIAKQSGQKVDWFFMGGRIVVKALGDMQKVRSAVRALTPEHNRLFREAAQSRVPGLSAASIVVPKLL